MHLRPKGIGDTPLVVCFAFGRVNPVMHLRPKGIGDDLVADAETPQGAGPSNALTAERHWRPQSLCVRFIGHPLPSNALTAERHWRRGHHALGDNFAGRHPSNALTAERHWRLCGVHGFFI